MVRCSSHRNKEEHGGLVRDGAGVRWPVTLSWVAARGFGKRGRNRAVVCTRRRDAGRGRLVAAVAEERREEMMGGRWRRQGRG